MLTTSLYGWLLVHMEVPLMARYSTTQNCDQCWKKEPWAFHHHLPFHMMTETLPTFWLVMMPFHSNHGWWNHTQEDIWTMTSASSTTRHEIPDSAWNYATTTGNSEFHRLGLYYRPQLTKDHIACCTTPVCWWRRQQSQPSSRTMETGFATCRRRGREMLATLLVPLKGTILKST